MMTGLMEAPLANLIPMTIVRFFQVAACALLLNAFPAHAATAIPPIIPTGVSEHQIRWSMPGASVELSIMDDMGRPVPIYFHHGWPLAVGQPAQKYGIRISNTTKERIKVLVSIDRMDPRTGRRAYRGQPGYVLDPGQAVQVANMHDKNRQVVPLAFPGQMPLIGGVEDMGHIDVAVFRERHDFPIVMPWSVPGLEISKSLSRTTRGGSWIPPNGAPFRPLSSDPDEILFLGYGLWRALGLDN